MSSFFAAALAVAPVAIAAVLGSIATTPNIKTWYAGLAKPSFTPPNWVFGPAWAALYLLMSYSFFRVLTSPTTGWRTTAIVLFIVQIALNAAWSWAFFAGHSPRGGLAVIMALWASVVLTVIAFWRVDLIAGLLLVPYLGWISFALVLNWQIAALNPR